jgi:imidazolonepropionase-like amidohydrolase
MGGLGLSEAARTNLIDLRRRTVRAYAAAGVPIMAGSDTAQAFHIWGVGLIEELEALVAAGLAPMAALRSATVTPRDYLRSLPNDGSAMGWKAAFGTVEAGARADLLLVRGDPSRDISVLRSLCTVVRAGRIYDRRALDHMLDQAAVRPAAEAVSVSSCP